MLLKESELSISSVSAKPILAPNRISIDKRDEFITDKTTIFLGGTCNGSKWRNKFILMLDNRFDPFDPVVDDWNEDAQREEEYHKANDNYLVFCITPKMTGFFSIAEMIDNMHIRPRTTVVCFLDKDDNSEFTIPQSKSIDATIKLLQSYGVAVFTSLEDMAEYFNSMK